MNCLPAAFLLALCIVLLPIVGAQKVDFEVKERTEQVLSRFKSHKTGNQRTISVTLPVAKDTFLLANPAGVQAAYPECFLGVYRY